MVGPGSVFATSWDSMAPSGLVPVLQQRPLLRMSACDMYTPKLACTVFGSDSFLIR